MSVINRFGPLALLVVSAVLLLSFGGAIVAAPITLPLLYLVARWRRSTPGYRWSAIILATLTAAEFAWGVTYLVVEDSKPAIWLLPLIVGILALVVFVTTTSSPSTGSTSVASGS